MIFRQKIHLVNFPVHFYLYASVTTRVQEDTGLKVLVPFSSQPGCLGALAVHP